VTLRSSSSDARSAIISNEDLERMRTTDKGFQPMRTHMLKEKPLKNVVPEIQK